MRLMEHAHGPDGKPYESFVAVKVEKRSGVSAAGAPVRVPMDACTARCPGSFGHCNLTGFATHRQRRRKRARRIFEEECG